MSAAAADPRARDWSLHSGERQQSPDFADANAAHRSRYAWAAETLGDRRGRFGVDVFCATGYGTTHLADRTRATMIGIDGCDEAITVARHAARHRQDVEFQVHRFPCTIAIGLADFIVSLESIEHVDDDAGFVRALAGMLAPGGELLISVPNEARIPCASFGNPFHVRHYTPGQLRALMNESGLELMGEYSQHIHHYVSTGWGVQRRGRIPDAEQVVRVDPGWKSNPCALLAHYRKSV